MTIIDYPSSSSDTDSDSDELNRLSDEFSNLVGSIHTSSAGTREREWLVGKKVKNNRTSEESSHEPSYFSSASVN